MARASNAKARPDGDGDDGAGAAKDQRASRGAGRGIWTGSISFGLLQIPITLFTAESRAEEIHFRMLDKHDLAPIKYERVSSATGKPVEWKDIVRGYEIEKDEFVVIDAEDLAKANVEKTQTIDIQDFVPRDQIDPAFFETPYYVVPQKRAAKAYHLLRKALERKNAAAIATFVLRTRERLVAVLPVGDALMLETLRFGHELKTADEMPIPTEAPSQAPTAREIAMAEQLVDGMLKDFEPSHYKDRYHRDVMKIIDEKAKTGATTEHHAAQKGVVAHDVVDLLELLKKSVANGGRGGGPANETRPRGPGLKKARPRLTPKKKRATA
jgi:DNA end-binding protein Ku